MQTEEVYNLIKKYNNLKKANGLAKRDFNYRPVIQNSVALLITPLRRGDKLYDGAFEVEREWVLAMKQEKERQRRVIDDNSHRWHPVSEDTLIRHQMKYLSGKDYYINLLDFSLFYRPEYYGFVMKRAIARKLRLIGYSYESVKLPNGEIKPLGMENMVYIPYMAMQDFIRDQRLVFLNTMIENGVKI